MKYLFIIGTVIALLNSVPVDAEVNEPVVEMKSTEAKPSEFQNAENFEAEKDTRVISEKTVESRDWVITAFTFLLAALTVMATLFGVFIGYMGYKSGKEYEKEVARAEDASRLAQEGAKKVEAFLRDIQQRGEETITGMQSGLQEAIANIRTRTEHEGGELTDTDKKRNEFFDKLSAKDEAGDYSGIADMLEGAIAFDQENVKLWYTRARALAMQGKYEDAMIKVNTAINKDPGFGIAYYGRGLMRLNWAQHDQRQPHKSEIIEDIKKATELGYEPEKIYRKFVSENLTDAEYKEAFGRTKEEDGFEKE